MPAKGEGPPEHSIRVSPRAKRPRLVVSPRDGLVVVIPRGYPVSSVPGILARHAAWIERALARTEQHRSHVASAADSAVPERVEMPGIGLVWRVELVATESAGVRARAGTDTVVLTGAVGERATCLEALRRAVSRAARERLPLMLGGVEAETGWSATGVTVRRQRTRWGSCTSAHAVSLNESLAFLPPHLVRHVLVHELAHTVRLDHSAEFWALVEAHDASWREHRRELRDAWRFVPAWAVID